jgi:hypothetical protein
MTRTTRPPRVSPALVVASVALAISLGGTGYAALRLPTGSVGPRQLQKSSVTSIKVKDGTLKLLDVSPSERSRLTGAKGDPGAKGDKGDRGDKGEKGDKGDKGDPGPASVPGYEQVFGSTLTIGPGAGQVVSATCPSGKKVLGGGAVANSTGAVLYGSFPASDTAWHAAVRNATAGPITAQAMAVCGS